MLLKRTPEGDEFTSPRAYDMLSHGMSLGRRAKVFDRAARVVVAPAGGSIIDVGCGTGALTFALARRFPDAQIRGIDPSATMVERARQSAHRLGLSDIDFETGTAQSLARADDSVDAITYSLSLHHVPAQDREAALGEAHRVLRPGGHIMIVEMEPHGVIARALSMHGTDITAELDIAGLLDRSGFHSVRRGRVTQRLLGSWTASS